MRNKALLLALTVVVACGAGPFRSGPVRPYLSSPVAAPAVQTAANVQAAANAVVAPAAAIPAQAGVAQVAFKGADGMNIQWDTTTIGSFDSPVMVCPGSQNFPMARSYRLKLSNIPNREGLVLYPTLTINAVSPRTRAYLDHNSIPVKFSDADFEQVANGNFVTKVIFLPSQKYQNLALAGGVDTIVNTQLPAGVDPIVEAQNRGAILAVVQIGNKDLGLGGASYDSYAGANVSGEQVPISGVNAPAFGTPASESESNAAELPTVPLPPEQALIQELSPNPSTGIPSVEDSTWNDSRL